MDRPGLLRSAFARIWYLFGLIGSVLPAAIFAGCLGESTSFSFKTAAEVAQNGEYRSAFINCYKNAWDDLPCPSNSIDISSKHHELIRNAIGFLVDNAKEIRQSTTGSLCSDPSTEYQIQIGIRSGREPISFYIRLEESGNVAALYQSGLRQSEFLCMNSAKFKSSIEILVNQLSAPNER